MKKELLPEMVELVITPPEPCGSKLAQHISSRTTLGALTQLIAQAKKHIVIASPFFQISEEIKYSPLLEAMKYALRRSVLLEVISTGSGISVFRTVWSSIIGNGRIRLFQPKPNIDDERYLGSHAKLLIVDSKHAYIGSANFTSPGLTGNLEVGVLVHGTIAAQVNSFLKYLVDIGFLVDIT